MSIGKLDKFARDNDNCNYAKLKHNLAQPICIVFFQFHALKFKLSLKIRFSAICYISWLEVKFPALFCIDWT